MFLAALFMHNLSDAPCPSFIYVGSGWANEKKEEVSRVFLKYMDMESPPGFNFWKVLVGHDGTYWAMRFTWQSGWLGGTLEELDVALAKYYGKKEEKE